MRLCAIHDTTPEIPLPKNIRTEETNSSASFARLEVINKPMTNGSHFTSHQAIQQDTFCPAETALLW
jgi:hypothetical protein